MGCHFLLQIFSTQGSNLGLPHCRQTLYHLSHQGSPILPHRKKKVKVKSFLTLCDHMDCSLPGSFIHGIFQARVPEWFAISFSRGISPTQGSNLGLPHCRQTLYHLSHQLISSCLNSNHPLDFYSFSKHPSEPDAAQAAVGALHLLRAFPCILTAHLCFQLPTKSSLPGALLLA